jgi:hypothetical protein
MLLVRNLNPRNILFIFDEAKDLGKPYVKNSTISDKIKSLFICSACKYRLFLLCR